MGNSTTPPPWSDLYIYAHTELDEHHTNTASCCQLCKYICSRDPISCLLPVLSHRPILRNIFVVKILLYSVPASLSIVLLKVASGRQSSGGVVVKALLLALHDKDKSFFINSRTSADFSLQRIIA